VSASTPPLAVVRTVIRALEQRGAVAAVGGSGLLLALGLTDTARDWDVTTDTEVTTVETALRSTGLPFRRVPAGDGSYATRARFLVQGEDHEVDVLVGFAVRIGDDDRGFPTRVTHTWQGLPMGDPEVWLAAYRALGRPERALALERWLDERRRGSDGAAER
jgi:hypothetical protein